MRTEVLKAAIKSALAESGSAVVPADHLALSKETLQRIAAATEALLAEVRKLNAALDRDRCGR
jgi:hypothetical protein